MVARNIIFRRSLNISYFVAVSQYGYPRREDTAGIFYFTICIKFVKFELTF